MKKRILFIGLDGACPEMVQRYLPELPNFRKLIDGGAWGPMLSTYPCDTPTNWTALATGATAGTAITGARTIDVAATLAAYLGIEPPRQNEGQALTGVLENGKP